MLYKIAAASSDGKKIDTSFGAAKYFYIYEVEENGEFSLSEIREWKENDHGSSCAKAGGCGNGSGGGCAGAGGDIPKLSLVEDCRSLLCKKIGFQAQKQLEKKAISIFEINYEVTESIEKIVSYFTKVDHHQSLRRSKHDR